MSRERKSYFKKIFQILTAADLWTIDQIYRFSVNMTKQEKGGERA